MPATSAVPFLSRRGVSSSLPLLVSAMVAAMTAMTILPSLVLFADAAPPVPSRSAAPSPAPVEYGLWTPIAPVPFARSDHTATTVGKSIYIAGGCDGSQDCDAVSGFCSCTSITTSLVRYDPATNTYRRLAPMPVARYRHLAVPIADVIYFFGGRELGTDAIILRVDAYNVSSNSWSIRLPTDPSSFYPSDLGSDNSFITNGQNTIFIFGGYTPDYSSSLATTYAFTPASDAESGVWVRKNGNMTLPRGDFAAVEVPSSQGGNGTKGLIYGGYSTQFPGPDGGLNGEWYCRPLNGVEMYDVDTDTWTAVGPLPMPLAEKDDGIIIGGRLYSIGGERKSRLSGCTDLDIDPVFGVFFSRSRQPRRRWQQRQRLA